MKVLFVMHDLLMIERLGIMYLAAVAKKEGHEVELLATERDDIHKKMKSYRPDVLAYSIHTGEHKFAIKLNKELKEKYNFVSIFGGPHATYFPEMIEEEGVDAICVGEGEQAFKEFLDNIQKKRSIKNVKNLWIKDSRGKIIKNPVRELEHDLDNIIFPDREMLYNYDVSLKEEGEKRIMIGRGCPYRCTYCFNRQMSKIYGREWGMVRKRSVNNVIAEVQNLKNNYSVEFIRIVDDTFIMCTQEWIDEFAEQWREKINIPFMCNIRANLVTPEKINALKRAGCISVFLAVETANDHVRNQILKRGMSKKQIEDACRLLREAGIKYGIFNILALPVENPYKIDLETLYFNMKLKPTTAWSSLLTPYPRTELGEYSEENGYFDGNYDNIRSNYKISSVLTFKNPSEKKKSENLQKLFGVAVSFPWLAPLVKQLVKLPPNKLFMYILMGWHGYMMKTRMSSERVTISRLLKWTFALKKHVKDY